MNTLREGFFTPFTAKELSPRGWLARQLVIEADGLAGNLDRVWPDVRSSAWIGGEREGWERVPYWLDGFIPLAFLLNDEGRISRARRYIDAIIERQADDGWLCPCEADKRGEYDTWAFILILKVLTVWHDCTDDERVEGVIERALRCLKAHIETYPLFNWGHWRYEEALIPVFWLYRRTGGEWLLSLADTLAAQGADWRAIFEDGTEIKTVKKEWQFITHVVNISMALKTGALEYLRGRESDPDELLRLMNGILDRYHGMACGQFSGDECLAGLGATQGTELCGVVEAMYSYETALAVSGTPEWGDRLERLAFNALPAAISTDMWSHQYDQQTNQVEAIGIGRESKTFGTNSPDAVIFGLEPNYGCCTANFAQGWPKFALAAYMRRGDDIALTVPLPSELRTTVKGVNVTVRTLTDYPFGDTVRVEVTPDAPVAFTLMLRVPGSAAGAYISDDIAPAALRTVAPGTYAEVTREWSGASAVTLTLRQKISFDPRDGGMFALRRGAVVFALPIAEDWEMHEYTQGDTPRKFPYCDWELRPKSEWEFAFASLDTADVSFSCRGVDDTRAPFDTSDPPMSMTVSLIPIDWRRDEHASAVARRLPYSRKSAGEPRTMRFIPYACPKLRLTELPVAER